MSTERRHPSVVERLIAWRWLLLGVTAALAALAWLPAHELQFDRSIENMFAPDDPILQPYHLLQRTFGASEMVMVAYDDAALMTSAGMARLKSIGDRVRRTAGVAAVLSLRSPLGEAILEPDDRRAAAFRRLFESYTHSADGRTAALVVMLQSAGKAAVPRATTIHRLRTLVQSLDHGTLTGEPVMVVDGFRYIEEDGRRLGWASTVLLGATILLCFRSVRWLVIPLAVVQLTLLLTRALLVWLEFRLSMVSSMLTAIVTVVGVATVIHLTVRFREARVAGRTPRAALQWAGALLIVPIVWSCLTDAAGFASLLVAGVGPIRDFGTMMATGALLVLVSVALVVPGLALAGGVDPDPRRAWGEDRLDRGLRGALNWVERRPRTIGRVTILLVAALAAGLLRVDVETDFTKNFRRGTPIVTAYQRVEDRLGGAAVWDIVLPAPRHLDWHYLARVDRLEARLRHELPGLTKVLSLVDGVRAGSPIDPARIRVALLRRAAVAGALRTLRTRMPQFYRALYGPDPQSADRHYYRVMLRSHERQGAGEKRALIQAVNRLARESFPEARVTGYFVLLTNLIHSVIRDQWITFAVATVAIGLMMLIAFRRLPLALIALIPNVLPILMVTGLMGFLGLKINMGAAMIAAVSIGLSVDSSIHYITAYRRVRAGGRACREALDQVQQTAGRAVVFSTLALIVGFSSLAFSQFVPTVYFGILVSLSMLGGLVGNLIVLPLLLAWLDGRA